MFGIQLAAQFNEELLDCIADDHINFMIVDCDLSFDLDQSICCNRNESLDTCTLGSVSYM